MTEIHLIATKYGRLMISLVLALLVFAFIRLMSSELLAAQIYGVGTMLIEVALTVYALDAVIRLVGTCDDQLLLLSPLPRWRLAIRVITVLCANLLAGYLATLLPLLHGTRDEWMAQIPNLVGYVVSTFTGLGMMLLIAYALKGINNRFAFLVLAWFSYVLVSAIAVGVGLCWLETAAPDAVWILGATSNESVLNLFAANIPITVLDATAQSKIAAAYILANAVLGIVCWVTAFTVSRSNNNFIKL
ncbi:hypothetical protein [Schaalia suimastitidis]|uniref:hypothetical protein n=1 Tax=Schaalia suimastitidis TaxID=121163 RepID=UPI00041E0E28|nr:hypothetical protein [Schaalia suimastitidis]